jgi:uncharacterized repeat protein (TIGR01451 family)
LRKYIALFAALVTALALAVPAGAEGEGDFTATGTPTLDSQFEGTNLKSGETVRVVVQLADEPLASYEGGVAGIPATSPKVTKKELNANSKAARDYTRYLEGKQSAFKKDAAKLAPSADIQGDYQVALNAVTVTIKADEIAQLRRLPGVVSVLPDKLEQLDTNVSPEFIGAPTAWAQDGGQENAGEGVIVGVLDSGIWPEHPSMGDPSAVGGAYSAPPITPGSNGFGSGGTRDTCDFGNTAFNPNDAPFTCNNKLIGAYTFLDTYKVVRGLLPTEFDSARDDNGHGTHTATTAAGNGGVDAELLGVDRGTVSGIAPRAHVIAYRVCGDGGCYQTDSVQAVEQAILDGVDVINFSISGGSSPYSDAVSLAFLGAYDAGVLVSASAGNSGPGADTTDHREPWTMTVGASTSDRHFLSTVTLEAAGDTLQLTGATVTDGIDTPTEVVLASDYGDDGQCNAPFPAGTWDGQIVVCERGVIARVEKSYNVAVGGAGGMLLYNPTLQGLATDNYFIPGVHLENDAGAELVAFMDAHSGETVLGTFTEGVATEVQGDVMAAFSSRGGPGQVLGVSKPDVTAPGVQILAGHTPMPATVEGGLPGQLFQSIQGTSMSSPHNAGAAALMKAIHPDWTPGQIRSALMTTALVEGVTKEDGTTPADAFDMGSGRIDLTVAANPGFTFDDSAANYIALEDRLWDANYPSLYIPDMPGLMTVERTIQSELSKKAKWQTDVVAEAGLKISLPKHIDVNAGGTASFDITVDARDVPMGETRMGRITFTSKGESLTFPVTIVRGEPLAAVATKTCEPATFARNATTTCTITVTNNSFEPADTTVSDPLPSNLSLVPGSVVGAVPDGNGIVFNGVLDPAEPPAPEVIDGTGTSPVGYLPLAGFGSNLVISGTDESIANVNVPPFVYAGETYSQIGMVSNGYAVVGGGTGADVDFINTDLPDPTQPNNVLAPYWTDLNPSSGGRMLVNVLGDGTNSWLVLEWENVSHWSGDGAGTFQIWIGVNGTQDISYTYGAVDDGDQGFLTVGAENVFGNRGNAWYFDGSGTPVAADDELRVIGIPGAPGETHTITFDAKGTKKGKFTNYVYVTSDQFEGTSIASFSGEVTDK